MFELFVPAVMQVLGAVASLLGAAALKSATFVKLVKLVKRLKLCKTDHLLWPTIGQHSANVDQRRRLSINLARIQRVRERRRKRGKR